MTDVSFRDGFELDDFITFFHYESDFQDVKEIQNPYLAPNTDPSSTEYEFAAQYVYDDNEEALKDYFWRWFVIAYYGFIIIKRV